MPKLHHSAPNYRYHKPSGQAVVTLSGDYYYLGPWRRIIRRKWLCRILFRLIRSRERMNWSEFPPRSEWPAPGFWSRGHEYGLGTDRATCSDNAAARGHNDKRRVTTRENQVVAVAVFDAVAERLPPLVNHTRY